MRTRRILLGAALAMAASALARQPAPPSPSPEVQRRIAAAKARLKLTPEQEPKLRALLEEESGKIRAMQAKYGADNSYATKTERARDLRAIRDDFRGKLKGLLTPEQMTEWDKMAAQRRAETKERRQESR